MRSVESFDKIFIHRAPVDMRKSIAGLSVIVDQEMKLSLQENSLFIFCNKRRTHIKMLYFDKSGFALWLKRLEASKFSWIKKLSSAEAVEISSLDLKLLLDGINIWTRFEKVCFDRVI
jgi:transposase